MVSTKYTFTIGEIVLISNALSGDGEKVCLPSYYDSWGASLIKGRIREFDGDIVNVTLYTKNNEYYTNWWISITQLYKISIKFLIQQKMLDGIK